MDIMMDEELDVYLVLILFMLKITHLNLFTLMLTFKTALAMVESAEIVPAGTLIKAIELSHRPDQ